ncbi:MAG TPA: hypothetical protein VH143_08215 [Kofleriaceae bacterium]|nr:hypothetical protein [Kofleriaceae bacterium]
MRIVSLVALFGLAFGCGEHEASKVPTDAASPAPPDSGATSTSSEWVGFHEEIPLQPGAFHPLASGLFGSDAQAGSFVSNDIAKGLTISAAADPSTPGQSQVTFSFDDGGTPRTLAVVPASYQVGETFVSAIDVALATMQADEAQQPGSGESFFIEYRVASAMGGNLSFGVRAGAGIYTLVIDISSPQTSLMPGQIGMAASSAGPYDSVVGTVNFHLSKDEFDYFVDHAYGEGATGNQNFSDFALVPHTWLRLTVTPHTTDGYINVGFVMLLPDGTRVAIANAPASIDAGNAYAALVDRNMETMTEQETAVKGSSTPWQVPFAYNQPTGGGTVAVLAQGTLGIFQIAYQVGSPQHALVDVPFLPWKQITLPPPDTTTCNQLGDPTIQLAMQGTFNMTFTASSVITGNPMGPLTGTIYCSIYHASDVDVSGPKPDAISVQDFTVANADLATTPAPSFVSNVILDGDYQVLCFQDRTGSGNVAMNDPVTLPIGSFPIACNKNPIDVEFALLDPEN